MWVSAGYAPAGTVDVESLLTPQPFEREVHDGDDRGYGPHDVSAVVAMAVFSPPSSAMRAHKAAEQRRQASFWRQLITRLGPPEQRAVARSRCVLSPRFCLRRRARRACVRD